MANKTLYDLADRLEAKVIAIEAACSETAISTANAMVAVLALNTPVDTSQALSNWIVTLDRPTTIKIGPHVPGFFGYTQTASAARTIAEAAQVLKAKKPGQPIYITNNQPYIRGLNEGTISKQPGGFVERAMIVGQKEAKKFQIKD